MQAATPHLNVYTYICMCMSAVPCSDACAEGLFEEGEGDLSLPSAVLESLLKVYTHILVLTQQYSAHVVHCTCI